jgi:hypothetical protein
LIQQPDFTKIQQQLSGDVSSFNEISLRVFRYQVQENQLYRDFTARLGIDPHAIGHYSEIPFLPVSFFKSHPVACFEPVWAERIYTSSGTTGSISSRHYVKHYRDYELSFTRGFEQFYGPPADTCILALLPDYLEREGSSLVEMARVLMEKSAHPENGFYLRNTDELIVKMNMLQQRGQRCLLLGVTFALLDLAEKGPFSWTGAIVMETGGMKGKRREMIRPEVHDILCQQFGVTSIHSEYGMTELLSQAYSAGSGIFHCPPWMKVLSRDVNDALSPVKPGSSGGLNIIDLANVHSCSFIATQDLGKVYDDGSFEVLGRFDNSDIRGCNLMVGE